jgi:choline-sulfatase
VNIFPDSDALTGATPVNPAGAKTRWFRLLLAAAVSWVVGPGPAVRAAGQPPGGDGKQPNILFIIIDDLNDMIGALGGPARTPHIDRLAAAGTLFTNAHCQATWCSPSRTSFLTGLRPSTTGVYTLTPWFRAVPALRSLVSLPQHFSQHGYETFATGKVYHDRYPPAGAARAEFNLMGYQGNYGPMPSSPLVRAPGVHRDFGIFPETDEQQEDWKVAESAIAYLRTLAGKPFFAFVGIRRPHFPLYASQEWFDLYPPETVQLPVVPGDDRDDLPAFARYLKLGSYETDVMPYIHAGKWTELVRAYLACISFVDHLVGRLLDVLEETGQRENTLIVLFSDHGHHLGEKLYIAKRTLWERSTRVPLIFAGPGIPGGQRCSRPVELIDLYPTLADLCALPAPRRTDGISLRPWLENPDAPRDRPAITTQMQGNFAVRTEKWRYIRYADGSEELYDSVNDPHEWHNLAHKKGHVEVKRELAGWIPVESAPPVPGSERTAGGFLTYLNGEARIDGKPIEEFEEEFRSRRR